MDDWQWDRVVFVMWVVLAVCLGVVVFCLMYVGVW
jgi:hypothetical protein